MFTSLAFAIVLMGSFIFMWFVSIDAKSHAKPWRLLLPAFVAIVLVFLLQTCIETFSSLLGKIDPNKDHLADLKLVTNLLSLVVIAFAGGMFSTAISLRAQILNSKESESLRTALAEILTEIEQLKTELKTIQNDSELSEIERQKKAEGLRETIIQRQKDKVEVSEQLKRISP